MQITDPNELFERIQQRVSRHRTHKKGAIRQHYDALCDTYLLGTYLIQKGTLKDFVQSREPKLWNKTAEKKPFQPLIQLAFADFPKATVSQQSTVLSYCQEVDFSVEEFKDMLHARGLVKLYGDAQEHKKSVDMPRRYELSAREESTWLAGQFEQLPATLSVDISEGQELELGLKEGEPTQFAARWKDGQLQIIQTIEMDSQRRDDFLRGIVGNPPNQSLNRLSEKNLFGLFKAADIFSRFSNNPLDFVEDKDWQETASSEIPSQLLAKAGLIFEFAQDHWCARTVAQLPTFRCVAVRIGDELGPLDRSKRYFLSSAQCHLLADQFLYDGEWVLSMTQGGPICECTSRSLSVSFLEFDPDLAGESFDQLDPTRKQECMFRLPLTKMRRASQWRGEHNAKDLNHIPFPRSFAFSHDGPDTLAHSFPLNPLITKPIADNFVDYGNTDFDDRFLLEKDLAALCELAMDYDLQLTGGLFSTFEQCNGIEIDLNDGTDSKISLPLAISVPGDLGQITERLK